MKCQVFIKLALTNTAFLALSTVSSYTVAENILRFNPFQQPDMRLDKASFNREVGNDLKLRGTVIDGSDSMVNIGGEFYRLNQEVDGYRIVRIESGKVTLHRGVNETVLTLNDDKTLR
jgi:hypothetical protein